MPHTHEFDCKICGEHLDSKKDLDRHNGDLHTPKQGFGVSAPDSAKAQSNGSHSFSDTEIAKS